MPSFDELNIGYNYSNHVDALSKLTGFETLITQITNLQEKLTKYNKPDPNQGKMLPPVSKVDKDFLLAEYAKISQEIANAKERIKADPSLLTDNVKEAINSLEQSVNGDTHALFNYDPEKSYMNLSHIFESSRPIKVDVSSKTLNKVGGSQSSRIPFKYTAPDGASYDGFFTESVTHNPYKDIQKQIEQLNGNPDLQNAFSAIIKLAIGDLRHVMKHANPEAFQKGFLSTIPQKLIDEAKNGVKPDTDEIVPYAISYLLEHETEKNTGKMIVSKKCLDTIVKELDELNQYEELTKASAYIKTHQNDPEFKKVLRFLADIENRAALHISCGIHPGDRIESRNAAMSSVASLLGKPNIIAKAIPMTIIRDGKEIKGCFMSNAEGIDPNQRTESDWIVKSDHVDKSPALAKMADLQVLDFICGNIDRHAGNLIYQYDKETEKVENVVGIDNDLSFGTYVPKDNDAFIQQLVPLNSMKVMTKSMASTLEKLSKEQLMQTLAPYNLSEKQTEACWKRTQMLKDKIAESRKNVAEGKKNEPGHISIIPDEGFELLKVDDLVSKFGKNNNKGNIFSRAYTLDVPKMQDSRRERKDVSQDKYIYDANAVRLYAKKGFETVDKMDNATNIRGTSPEFENLKKAIDEFGKFHQKRRGAMMNEGEILAHDKMLTEIMDLSDIYLQHARDKKKPSTYAKDRAQLVSQIKSDFSKLNIRSKLSKNDLDIIHQQDIRNMNRLGSEMRAKAQVNAMKAYLNYDATIISGLANSPKEEIEAAVANQILHSAIAAKYCNEEMEIKLSDFSKIQTIINNPEKHIEKIKNSQYFKDIVNKLDNPEAVNKYADKLAKQYKVNKDGEMRKTQEFKPEPDLALNL